jgi:hypothetical protein
MTGLVTAWLTEVVLISYRATKQGTNQGTASVPFPLPSRYAGTFVIYGALGLLPQSAGNLAAAIGWGIVLATFLNLYNPLTAWGAAGKQAPTVAKSGTTNAIGNTAA